MNVPRAIVAVLMVLVGIVWILQGLTVLPGSFMTGRREWAFYGAIAVVAGLYLLATARRRR